MNSPSIHPPSVRLSPPLARPDRAAGLHLDHGDKVRAAERTPVRVRASNPSSAAWSTIAPLFRARRGGSRRAAPRHRRDRRLQRAHGVGGRKPARIRPPRALLGRRRQMDEDRRRRGRAALQMAQRSIEEMVADVVAGVGRDARRRGRPPRMARAMSPAGAVASSCVRARSQRRRRRDDAAIVGRRRARDVARDALDAKRRRGAPPARSSAPPRASAARTPRRTRRRMRRRRRAASARDGDCVAAAPAVEPACAASHEALTVSPPNGSKPVTRIVAPIIALRRTGEPWSASLRTCRSASP